MGFITCGHKSAPARIMELVDEVFGPNSRFRLRDGKPTLLNPDGLDQAKVDALVPKFRELLAKHRITMAPSADPRTSKMSADVLWHETYGVVLEGWTFTFLKPNAKVPAVANPPAREPAPRPVKPIHPALAAAAIAAFGRSGDRLGTDDLDQAKVDALVPKFLGQLAQNGIQLEPSGAPSDMKFRWSPARGIVMEGMKFTFPPPPPRKKLAKPKASRGEKMTIGAADVGVIDAKTLGGS